MLRDSITCPSDRPYNSLLHLYPNQVAQTFGFAWTKNSTPQPFLTAILSRITKITRLDYSVLIFFL